MTETLPFRDDHGRATSFFQTGGEIRLLTLCGVDVAGPGTPAGMPGLLAFEGGDGAATEADFRLHACHVESETSFQIQWHAQNSSLHWLSFWNLDRPTGVWSRCDTLSNPGDRTLRITRALARFTLPGEHTRFYFQKSTWAHENQGEWMADLTRAWTIRSTVGRTNQGASPYLFAGDPTRQAGIVFHLLPCGNWVIHLQPVQGVSSVAMDLGLTDEGLQLDLPPGTVFELPEILIQPVPSAQPEAGAPVIHKYVLERFFPRQAASRPFAPLVYNTWFDAFEDLHPERCHRQLNAAIEIGCEVFVVDAGWYGNGAGRWDRQVGDWSEKKQAAFQGRMREFSDQVRQAGLGFGLWMEPERLAAGAPILSAHPDWFVLCPHDYFRPDLSQMAAREYLWDEITRLVETYELAWMKIDFNLEMDQAKDGLAGYYQLWYELLDRLRGRFPGTFFEGCASGGMRLDLNSLHHFDGHFLSDTVHPVDMLRITQGTLLRAPAGRLTRWAVLRPEGSPDQIITPEGAGWERSFPVEVDFVCRAALPGMLGYSGDLAGLSPQVRQRLRWYSEFYKAWRTWISGSICHLLTPIQPLQDRTGWVAFQFQDPQDRAVQLLFVYRLEDESPRQIIRLRGLEPGQVYHLTNLDQPELAARVFSGRELMEAGFAPVLSTRFSAGLWKIALAPEGQNTP